jgi:flavin-dependent dehydrogenase
MRVAIIGGGLAGLISSIELTKKGVPCLLFERKKYPFHRVCGEYVSNEALPYLKKIGLYPEKYAPPHINRFLLSSVRGQSATMPLDLGGFGISRYAFDNFLFEEARACGVEFRLEAEVTDISFVDGKFQVTANADVVEADIVIGAYGKRSKLDITLQRDFVKKRSPYVGVKYHRVTDHPHDLVALHNFVGGYCGVGSVENNVTNICYLAERSAMQLHGGIEQLEEKVLFQNPLLKHIFQNSDPLESKPVVINEISFATKSPVENHILMTGDSAGMITPLCGNGMAMAIHSAQIVSGLVMKFFRNEISRQQLEQAYTKEWKSQFAFRLKTGRTIQKFFGNQSLSQFVVKLALNSPLISKMIIKNTHGKPF